MLMVRGDPAAAATFAEENDLSFRDLKEDGGETLLSRNTGLAEIVIPPRSALVGRRSFPGMITPEGDLVILAIQRNGQDVAEGEHRTRRRATRCCCRGPGRRSTRGSARRDVLIVDSPDLVRRQAVPLGRGGAHRARRHGRHGAAAGDRARAAGRGRAARRRGAAGVGRA